MEDTRVPYYSITALVKLIEGAQGDACRRMLMENRTLFETAPGSSHNHQAWPGGYADHVTEIMNIGLRLYETLGSCRPLPFTLSDVLLVLFLHDIEKPWRFEVAGDGSIRQNEGMRTRAGKAAFREFKLLKYGIDLSPDQRNAFTYVEGEIDHYSSERRVMNPLAAFCHLCDVTSARIWFDRPAESDDEWSGAHRSHVPKPA